MHTRNIVRWSIGTAIAGLVLTASPAHATRGIAGYDYPDLCKNHGEYAMRGKQSVEDVLSGYVQYVDPYQEPNYLGKRDCVRPSPSIRRR